jgi:hypothetical protein
MKKLIFSAVILIILGYCSYSLYLVNRDYYLVNSPEQKVLIAYDRAYLKSSGYVLDAYKSVLTEEGVPWEAVEISNLITTEAKRLARTKPVVIFPDGILQIIPEASLNWVKEYLNNAGSVAVIYDAGIKEQKGTFRKQALLADVTGVNYITYGTAKDKAYTTGSLQFTSQQTVDYLQIPPGKKDEALFLNGYLYGRLRYPIARNEYTGHASGRTLLASVVTGNGEKYPAVVLNTYGRGNVLYVNLPLGYLKAYSDGLPLQAFLRAFLFETVKISHLQNTEKGVGGLVINWHIDSNIEWAQIPLAIKNNILDKDLRYSIHITAGDFRDEKGDGLGFDACGNGRRSAQSFLPFGVVGSHGGWAHNWFADNVENGKLTKDDMSAYIARNNRCLESVAGYPMLEYSAPVGVHPQPLTTGVLEKHGFNSYYYTGDSGSAPNRTFSNGVMVSSQVIAFPVLSYNKSASLYEMKEEGLTEAEVQKWLFDIVDYVIGKRTTRLFYSHLHDVSDYYPQAVRNFLQYAKQKQAEGKLSVEPMSVYAGYFQKFIQTTFSFRQETGGLVITLNNKKGLKGMTVAVPRNKYKVEKNDGVGLVEDDNYYYLTVNEDVKEKAIIAHTL